MSELEQLLKIFEGIDDHLYSFPSNWFKENPGKKPTINVCFSQDKPGLRESLARSLYAEISCKEINIEHAITFLYIYAKDTMKERLNEDWKSYSLTIGLKGSTITPMNIIDANLKDFNFENLKDTNVHLPSSDDWLVFYLCTLYRGEPSAGNHEKIANIAIWHSAIRALDFNIINEYALTCDTNYRALIAAYDMFLHKFPNNSAKFCRIGTSESRLRYCAGLSSVYRACKCLGMKNIKDLVKWTTCPLLRNAFEMLFSDKEEYSNEYSYFMYQMDFLLTHPTRPAYSASRNVVAHSFCKLIAGLCLDERGLRAKFLCNSSNEIIRKAIIKNAILVAYAYRVQTFEELSVREPKSRDPDEWKHFMSSREWKLTDNMLEWLEDRRSKIGHTHPGTVGEILKNTHIFS